MMEELGVTQKRTEGKRKMEVVSKRERYVEGKIRTGVVLLKPLWQLEHQRWSWSEPHWISWADLINGWEKWDIGRSCWVLSQLSRLIGLEGRPQANWICRGLINSGKPFFASQTHRSTSPSHFIPPTPTSSFFSKCTRKHNKKSEIKTYFFLLFPTDQTKGVW